MMTMMVVVLKVRRQLLEIQLKVNLDWDVLFILLNAKESCFALLASIFK